MVNCFSGVLFCTLTFFAGTWLTSHATANSMTAANATRLLNATLSAQLFSQKLVSKFGSEGTLDVRQLGVILEQLGIHNSDSKTQNCAPETVLATCGVEGTSIEPSQLQDLCPSILYSAATGECASVNMLDELSAKDNETDESPSQAEMWGYGFLFVTIINFSAVGGIIVLPIMNKQMYKTVLTYLISLAVGTLCGNALLSLIPEAHDMFIEEYGTTFIWKNMTVIGGIYLFFLTERILKIISHWRRKNYATVGKPSANELHTTAMHNVEPLADNGIKITAPHYALNMTDSLPTDTDLTSAGTNSTSTSNKTNRTCPSKSNHGHSHDHVHLTFEKDNNVIASVAYMIIFGDGLHNFIDGLAIGASFAYATYAGVSTSIAVICEEFPHELGDFAILLNSGMTVKQALLANIASAFTCYAGLVIGILLGELTSAGSWIFALAGGMFLYISLVDMLPEMNSAHLTEGDEKGPATLRSMLKVFLIQNLGLLTGFALMLILALYAGKIQI